VFTGSLFRVDVETWPGGRRRDIAHHVGAGGAVVLIGEPGDHEQVLLVRQFREAVGRSIVEIPAGVYDIPNEDPETAIRREINEETAYRTTMVEPLGRILTTPGFSDEGIDLFLVRAEPDPSLTAEEGIETVVMHLDDAVGAALDGSLEDAKTVVALLRAAHRLG
jgi:ADP-ribose pyrophosphatase